MRMNENFLESEESRNGVGTVSPLRRRSVARTACRILYVDDEPILTTLGRQVLSRAGYQVDIASDGAVGWEFLTGTRYHLLVTDNNMPRVTGMELISKIRWSGMHLPIILTSGFLNELPEPAITLDGLTAFLPKPFTHDALLGLIEHLLDTAYTRDQTPEERIPVSAGGSSASSYRQWGTNE